MKKNIITAVIISFAFFSVTAQADKKILTAGNYEQASKFLGVNTNKLVDRSNVSPNWLADGKLWYSVSVAGKKEYVLINPADGNRKTAPDASLRHGIRHQRF